ncbi:radical SAM protein [Streptomyces tuirus]|uniref:Radical SAM protein n=1 Tax=Streptomyces tuirus TaxID=68278 RepID=A0A941FGT9_9ACTN|nr:radical SAM protein [Streptomyces tuirus]
MALTSSDIARIRADRGSSALLFLTDRCPVECAHCSVGSLRSGPGIADWPRFTSLVAGLAAHRRIRVVAISGGDPFAERRGLSHAVRELSAAGKQLVLHTSGFFGAAGWAQAVLRRSETVVLSTDRHHRARLPDEVWLAAARLIRACGAWLVVQSIDEDADQAAELLRRAFGRGWAAWAEIVRQPGLPHGRGADWYRPVHASSGERCALVGTPVVRYDGTVTACCNETVITGGGPDRLRRKAATAGELHSALDSLDDDPVLWAIGAAGPAALRPGGGPDGICAQCWRVLEHGTGSPAFTTALRGLREGAHDL